LYFVGYVTAVTQRIREPLSAVDRELAAYALPALSEDYPVGERLDRFLVALNSLSLIREMALADQFLADQLFTSLVCVFDRSQDFRSRMVPARKSNGR
jgi:hypothetical protein